MRRLLLQLFGAALVVLVAGTGGVYAYFGHRIVSHTSIGVVAVGAMTPENAADALQVQLDALSSGGLVFQLGNSTEVVYPDVIGYDLNFSDAIDQAYARGHRGSWWQRVWERSISLVVSSALLAPMHYDAQALDSQITDFATANDIARKDIRLDISGTTVSIRTDTEPGKTIDRGQTARLAALSLSMLDTDPISLELHDDMPRATGGSAQAAKKTAQDYMARPLTLIYEDAQFTISRSRIGSWITNEYTDDRLSAGLSTKAIGQYVTTVAQQLYVAPTPADVITQDGKVIRFVPPKRGQALEESKTTERIIAALEARAEGTGGDTITLPVMTTSSNLDFTDMQGITELVGEATTTFTGSPKNRISNIKNGVKFLSGILVQPGEEFSTLGTLGTIDNTTGYLPELVIKGDQTTPEFGGGLCQVSTTLFRAVLNAGLPVTERQNHSYRVSYYEKDGNGKFIGPGLDATVYEPRPDFRFRNDMGTPVLVIGFVEGTKVTFQLYGTKDGRSSLIIGPRVLTETPAGDPIYTETDTLAPGVKKQVETAHPGGSAIATYVITYPDGTKDAQEFKSYYRRWPARYLVGVSALPSPSPSPSPTPTAGP